MYNVSDAFISRKFTSKNSNMFKKEQSRLTTHIANLHYGWGSHIRPRSTDLVKKNICRIPGQLINKTHNFSHQKNIDDLVVNFFLLIQTSIHGYV